MPPLTSMSLPVPAPSPLNHPVTTTVQGRVEESRKSVIGKVRGGGPTISVHTGSGDIEID